MASKPDYHRAPWNPAEKLSRQDSEISILRRDVKELLMNMASLREEKDARISRLEAALREIAEHPHCQYKAIPVSTGSFDYKTGMAEGHRCAAEIAKRVLQET